jgi:hypothetical protein
VHEVRTKTVQSIIGLNVLSGMSEGLSSSMTEWLPFLHPVWQIVGIALGFMALREGLALRRGRRTQAREIMQSARRWRHARLGKCSWWIIGSGYFLGIGELFFIRDKTILRSAHFYFATIALALFCWGALYGLAMLRDTGSYAQRRDLHGFLLPLALLMMVGVGLLGLMLLP